MTHTATRAHHVTSIQCRDLRNPSWPPGLAVSCTPSILPSFNLDLTFSSKCSGKRKTKWWACWAYDMIVLLAPMSAAPCASEDVGQRKGQWWGDDDASSLMMIDDAFSLVRCLLISSCSTNYERWKGQTGEEESNMPANAIFPSSSSLSHICTSSSSCNPLCACHVHFISDWLHWKDAFARFNHSLLLPSPPPPHHINRSSLKLRYWSNTYFSI